MTFEKAKKYWNQEWRAVKSKLFPEKEKFSTLLPSFWRKERTKKEEPKNTVNEFNELFKKKKSKTKVYLKNTFGF